MASQRDDAATHAEWGGSQGRWRDRWGTRGVVSVHVREQGRPQGARLRAGDVSRDAGRPELPRHRRLPLLQAALRRGLRHRPHGGDEQPRRSDGPVLGLLRQRVRDLLRFASAALRRRGPHHAAAGARGVRGHYRARGLRRSRQDLPGLGARALQGASERAPRARAPPRRDAAAAAGRAPVSGPMDFPSEQAGMHVPVLLPEAIAALAPRDDGLYVDGTFGAGNYSRAILEAARCRVVALDRDPAAVKRGGALASQYAGRLTVVEGRFGDLEQILAKLGIARVTGIALDLGFSSDQMDDPARGFSFR